VTAAAAGCGHAFTEPTPGACKPAIIARANTSRTDLLHNLLLLLLHHAMLSPEACDKPVCPARPP
jgi:hypothetical protein